MREVLAGTRVAVDGRLVSRLESICATTVDDIARTEAAADWWPLSLHWARADAVPALPAAVARPTSAAEVAAVLAVCHEEGLPVTPVAGRSGVCGGSVPVHGGVALDLCGLDGIVAVDDGSLLVDVRPGTNGLAFEESLRSDHGLTLGHWPQSVAISTVGGWVACRSAGQYSTRYGKVEDMVVGLDVALADGRLLRTGGRGPRAASGPDLTQLFVGSEGTFGIITQVTLRAHPLPSATGQQAWGFPSFADGLDACRRILRRGATPAVLRLYDERESKRGFATETNVLLVLDEADPALLAAVLGIVAQECGTSGQRLDEALVDRWLGHRNDVSQLHEVVAQGIVVDTCEIAARWTALPAIYEAGVAAVRAVPGTWVVSAHQSHSYVDGACLYFTFAGQREDADRYYVEAWDALTRAVLTAGGTLSHHHGVGLNRGRFMAEAMGPAFDVLVAMKHSLDPKGILNPGKLGLPSPWGEPGWP